MEFKDFKTMKEVWLERIQSIIDMNIITYNDEQHGNYLDIRLLALMYNNVRESHWKGAKPVRWYFYEHDKYIQYEIECGYSTIFALPFSMIDKESYDVLVNHYVDCGGYFPKNTSNFCFLQLDDGVFVGGVY